MSYLLDCSDLFLGVQQSYHCKVGCHAGSTHTTAHVQQHTIYILQFRSTVLRCINQHYPLCDLHTCIYTSNHMPPASTLPLPLLSSTPPLPTLHPHLPLLPFIHTSLSCPSSTPPSSALHPHPSPALHPHPSPALHPHSSPVLHPHPSPALHPHPSTALHPHLSLLPLIHTSTLLPPIHPSWDEEHTQLLESYVGYTA